MTKSEMAALEVLVSAIQATVHNDRNTEQKDDIINLIDAAQAILWRALGKLSPLTRREMKEMRHYLIELTNPTTLERTKIAD